MTKTQTSPIVLDRPEVLRAIFHPRREYPSPGATSGARSISVEVEQGICVGGRLYPAGRHAPAILLWHGNGEIASDYDFIGPLYANLGITLLVFDYRAYGTSDGSPACSNLLSDALTVFGAVEELFARQDLAPARLYAMGRSLGSAAAIEVASSHGDHLDGLIVESGFADTFALLERLGVYVRGATEPGDGFDNARKMETVTIPTLIIHGRKDVLIPAADGEELFHSCAAEDKRLVLIPGAGHNDLLLVGNTQYFQAIRSFVLEKPGGPDS
jgi:alpha-beta hydrolase superfamily lysophospholipase